MTVAENKNIAWFCLQSQPKHEHIAAAHLKQMDAVEVFLPRIRFKRATRQGAIWTTEALFTGYFFARFHWYNSLRQIQGARGVRSVVHFGERWPTIPDVVIEDLRRVFGTTELHTIPTDFAPGDDVQITDGAMRGLHAVVLHVMPGRKRIAVLMEFIGRQTTIVLPADFIVREGEKRAEIL
jgi:transcriptional antiterminator RfaH